MKNIDRLAIWIFFIICYIWITIVTNIQLQQYTQQILQAISWSQLSIEMLVTEQWLTDAKCYFDDNTWYWWTNIPCPSKEELPLQFNCKK